MSIPFLVDEKPTVVRSARPESGREVRKRCLMTPFARTQSEVIKSALLEATAKSNLSSQAQPRFAKAKK